MASITIRDVPKKTHDELAARAKHLGQSLQAYVREELTRIAQRPDPETFWASVEQRKKRFNTRLSPEDILRYRDEGRR